MQYSVHPPTAFLRRHTEQLLPAWSLPIASVLIVLQRCPCDLLRHTPTTEQQKHRLRQQSLRFGRYLVDRLEQTGHLSELFDPCTGFPVHSQPGILSLDDVALVRECLGYSTLPANGCQVLLHPDWGSAVYPSTLVSSAAPWVLEPIVQAIVASEGFGTLAPGLDCAELWTPESTRSTSGSTGRRGLSENHQSLMGCGSFTE